MSISYRRPFKDDGKEKKNMHESLLLVSLRYSPLPKGYRISPLPKGYRIPKGL